jgi:hypothetical protein
VARRRGIPSAQQATRAGPAVPLDAEPSHGTFFAVIIAQHCPKGNFVFRESSFRIVHTDDLVISQDSTAKGVDATARGVYYVEMAWIMSSSY